MTGHRLYWLLVGIALLASMGFLAAAASAQRQATARESEGMWRTVERQAHIDGCVERRGQISTAHTPRRKFGTVVIADSHCGNGQFVLAKQRGGSGGWRILGAGSDWGNPSRCASDLRRIPRRVLEDFFGDGYCAGTGAKRELFAAATDLSGWRLAPTGIGPLRLGMSAAKARALVPNLRVAHHQYCDAWTVPGLDGVAMFSTHSRGGLSGVSISRYSEDLEPGHGAGGVEIGDSLRALKQRFGPRLHFVQRIRGLGKAFYRLYPPPGGRRTALEFTVDVSSGKVEFEEAGFVGEFYYTDGVELCA